MELDAGIVVEGVFKSKSCCGWGWAVRLTWVHCKKFMLLLNGADLGIHLEVEVRDKRHVGLASTNMEKVALKNALTRLKRVLDVVEVATDASSSIKI